MLVRLGGANRYSSCGCVVVIPRRSPSWAEGRPTLTDSDDATDQPPTSLSGGS
jgi:hypothetical protein